MRRSQASRGKRKGPPSRLGVRDWEIAALEMIGERGVSGLAIEPLARRLGVTKGSFYWHFSSLDQLLEASLARWERVFTDGKYGALDERPDPVERLRALFADVASGDPALGVFLAFALSDEHPLVRPVFRRVTAKRLRFLARALRALGLTRQAAEDRAALLYSAYVGFLQVARQVPPRQLPVRRRKHLADQGFRLLVPEAEKGRPRM